MEINFKQKIADTFQKVNNNILDKRIKHNY
jgi:hypothetical protein